MSRHLAVILPAVDERARSYFNQGLRLTYGFGHPEAVRYEAEPDPGRRAALDSTYADAMREVVREFPHDLDAATLFAEALMVLRPWDQWQRDGTPNPGTEEVDARFARAWARADVWLEGSRW
jgi:hypothetical protein